MCQTTNKISNFGVKKETFQTNINLNVTQKKIGLYNLKCLSIETKPYFLTNRHVYGKILFLNDINMHM